MPPSLVDFDALGPIYVGASLLLFPACFHRATFTVEVAFVLHEALVLSLPGICVLEGQLCFEQRTPLFAYACVSQNAKRRRQRRSAHGRVQGCNAQRAQCETGLAKYWPGVED